jgi:regulator of sirC expression with transglutaminase-like and TPR domain
MDNADLIRRFRALTERDDEKINLAEAALVIAAAEYAKLTPEPWLARLDHLAEQVQAIPESSPLANIEALNQILFEQEKFSGNDEEYDDPRNSFLNDVLERKKGIPITLSLVYMEVARQPDLPVVGVGFPGHFLVKYLRPGGEILIDPYHRGAILSPADCEALLKAHFGAESDLKLEYLLAATNKQILARMLNNLKGSYFRRANYPKVLTMIELALSINEDRLPDLRDRGMVYFAMGRYADAVADLKAYLALAPSGDSERKEILRVLHRIRALMN